MAIFYRVVSPAERDDILESGRLRACPISMDGKHLWGSIEDAKGFADSLLLRGWESECIMLQVEVSDAAAERFEYMGPIDGIGRAWFARLDDLEGAVVRKLR